MKIIPMIITFLQVVQVVITIGLIIAAWAVFNEPD